MQTLYLPRGKGYNIECGKCRFYSPRKVDGSEMENYGMCTYFDVFKLEDSVCNEFIRKLEEK